MVRVAVTGAAGSVGRETLKALSDRDVRPITHSAHEGIDSVVLDVEDKEALEAAFEGIKTVVHLAAVAVTGENWDRIQEVNIHGTYNVFEAARTTGVDRVVFASSNHVTHMYNMPNASKPGHTKTNPRPVSPDDPFRPSSLYGVSKLAGEGIGSLYADRDGIEVINLRIGYLQDVETLREHQQDEPDRARQARAMFLSPRDYRHAIRRTVDSFLEENPVTLNLTSRNDERYHSLTETMRAIDYSPRDNSAELLED